MPVQNLPLYKKSRALIQAIRETLDLRSLSRSERCVHQGKWFAGAHDFARRAALCRDSHGPILDEIPYRGADIRAQQERVELLEDAVYLLQKLTKEAADTLLLERSRLYRMSSGVLQTMTGKLSCPFLPDHDRRALQGGYALLRQEFDQRNAKISAARRAAPASHLPNSINQQIGGNPSGPASSPADQPPMPELPPPGGR